MNDIVGNKIKELRKSKRLSQEEVADFLNVSQSTYARIEKGESNSWVNNIAPICELFDIKPDELLKQDTIVISQNQQGGNSNNAYVINQLSEKLISQFEETIKEKDAIILMLKTQLESLK
ncbi:MAG: transcriptional regulator [Flavobacterium sp.]|nr:MAG: transcriptional regulator [Flavobacterium sp.]